jgi:hypothetical protein
VNVEGIFDLSQYGSNGPYGELAYLADADIPVSIADNPYGGKLHDKATADKYYAEFLRIRDSYCRGTASIDKITVPAATVQTVKVTLRAPSTYPITKVKVMAQAATLVVQ